MLYEVELHFIPILQKMSTQNTRSIAYTVQETTLIMSVRSDTTTYAAESCVSSTSMTNGENVRRAKPANSAIWIYLSVRTVQKQ
jgi:hypothetical protein